MAYENTRLFHCNGDTRNQSNNFWSFGTDRYEQRQINNKSHTIKHTMLFFVFFTEKYTEDEIFSYMKIMWEDQYVSDTKVEAEKFWNDVQIGYTCCGLNSYDNYNSTVPESCCAKDVNPCSIDSVYRINCFNAVKRYFDNVLVIILATVAFAMSFVCLVFTILAQFSMRIFGLPEVFENVSVL